jgi:PAS domain S-box-containing protein
MTLLPPPDFQTLFQQSPAPFLVLAPDEAFTIIAVTDAYLRSTLRRREELVGQALFEAFPDNPADPHATGTRNVRASLEQALTTRAPASMPVQKYDIARPEGGFEERYWSAINTPLQGADGQVRYLVHQVEDVTHVVRLAQQSDADRARLQALTRVEAASVELRVREAWLSTVLTSIGDAVIVTDVPGRVTFINPAAQALIGWPGETALGRLLPEVFRIVDETTRSPVESRITRALKEGQAVGPGNRCLLLRPDGTECAIDDSAAPIRDASGGVMGGVLVFRDVTEVRAAERALARSETYLRRVLEANQVGTWELEFDTQGIEADARLRELFGLSDEARHLDAFLSRIHPEDVPRTRAAIAEAITGKDGGRYLVEYRTVDPRNGRVRWLEARGQAYFGSSGRAERFFGTVLEITERKVAELTREGLLEALAAQSAVFIALLRGPRLVFELTNPLYQTLFRGQQLDGRPLLEAVPELAGQGLDTLMHETLATGTPYIGREMVVPLVRTEEGRLEDAIFNFVYQPVRGADGTYDGILITGVEVTQEVRVREEAQARLAFEERLTGIVGHDLRSPLSALLMSAHQLLPGGPHANGLTPGQVRAVERVVRGGRRIQAVISSLLDLTRARGARGFPIRPAPADLDATARAALDELRASHPQRTVHYARAGDTRGHFDSERIAQVAVNLLENAFKYGDADAAVAMRCEDAGPSLRMVVHNRGTPISAELQARLFQPFTRGPQSADTVKLSLGLGLYIVREIVRAHGGSVTLDSSAEAGTTVTVELPREHDS